MEITSVSNSAKRNVERPKRELILANGRKDLLFDWLIDFHPENQCKSIVPRPDVVIDAESCTQTPDASENDEESSLNSLLEAARTLGVEEALTKWCIQQRTRLERLAREYSHEYPGDVRLEHFAIYLMKCKAPEHTINLAILEQIVEDIRTEEETWVTGKGWGTREREKKINRLCFYEGST